MILLMALQSTHICQVLSFFGIRSTWIAQGLMLSRM
jgi:hypothetical protein